jgi:hypothetical protein
MNSAFWMDIDKSITICYSWRVRYSLTGGTVGLEGWIAIIQNSRLTVRRTAGVIRMKYNIEDETFGIANRLEQFYELSDDDFASALIGETQHWSLIKRIQVWLILRREPWKSFLELERKRLEAVPPYVMPPREHLESQAQQIFGMSLEELESERNELKRAHCRIRA